MVIANCFTYSAIFYQKWFIRKVTNNNNNNHKAIWRRTLATSMCYPPFSCLLNYHMLSAPVDTTSAVSLLCYFCRKLYEVPRQPRISEKRDRKKEKQDNRRFSSDKVTEHFFFFFFFVPSPFYFSLRWVMATCFIGTAFVLIVAGWESHH